MPRRLTDEEREARKLVGTAYGHFAVAPPDAHERSQVGQPILCAYPDCGRPLEGSWWVKPKHKRGGKSGRPRLPADPEYRGRLATKEAKNGQTVQTAREQAATKRREHENSAFDYVDGQTGLHLAEIDAKERKNKRKEREKHQKLLESDKNTLLARINALEVRLEAQKRALEALRTAITANLDHRRIQDGGTHPSEQRRACRRSIRELDIA